MAFDIEIVKGVQQAYKAPAKILILAIVLI